MQHYRRLLVVVATAISVIIISLVIMEIMSQPAHRIILGVSFDPVYAAFLGVDPKNLYRTILDEWQFRYIRLSATWEAIEGTAGTYDFNELDYWFEEAAERQAKIILATGQKTPRWPECHHPAWAAGLPASERRAKLLAFMQAVVERYHTHPALEIWQIENEPFLHFGLCPPFSRSDLATEIALIKKIDLVHPVIITDSGELSSWLRTARAGDLFGTTIYRQVWNRFIGYWSYHWLPPAFYQIKLWLTGRAVNQAFVVELQAEPWIPNQDVKTTPMDEQFKSFTLERFARNIMFVRRVGFPRAYLWGAEWWAWAASQGYGEFAEYIKNLPKE